MHALAFSELEARICGVSLLVLKGCHRLGIAVMREPPLGGLLPDISSS
jgi:hypothetical protein